MRFETRGGRRKSSKSRIEEEINRYKYRFAETLTQNAMGVGRMRKAIDSRTDGSMGTSFEREGEGSSSKKDKEKHKGKRLED
jgi:hypothetical protein